MHTEQTRVLFDALDRLSCARTTCGVIDILKEGVRVLASADAATVMLRDGGSLYVPVENAAGPVLDGPRFKLEACIDGWVVLNRQYALIDDVFADPRMCSEVLDSAIRSLAVFPIRSADPIGAVGVYWNDRRAPEAGLVRALQTLANAAAISIENTRLFGWVEVAYRSARQEAHKFASLVNTVNGVVWEANRGSFRFTFVSNQAEHLLGYPLAAWMADDFWLEHLHPDDRHLASEFRLPKGARDRCHFEYRMIGADGRTVWVSDYVSVARGADNSEFLRGVLVDVTEQKALEHQLVWHGLYDSLTSLPNRAHFLDDAEKEVRDANGHPGHTLAVLFLDLDRFKHVNDSFGHLAGDALLMAVASRLRTSVRESETVARLSGDEFAILAPGAGHPAKAQAIADRIHAAFSRPFNIAGSSVYLTASIGIALQSGIRRSGRDLLREADTAMYRAKKAGRSRSQFFDASMRLDAVSRLRLESDLRKAVARHQFDLHYQPIVEIDTRKVVGFEALLRWPHPSEGLLLPSKFLAAAEDLDLMVELGYDSITSVCAVIRRWSRRGSSPPWISVNLSPVQLHDPNLPRLLRIVLNAYSIPPESLKLEVTEAGMVLSEAAMRERLQELRELGVGILIDDFGTGMSSLSRLVDAPVDIIKIDRRFVEEIGAPDSSAPVLRSIITLGRNLNVGLIAEGVESERQALGLQELGCEAGQGFYFARPEPLDRAEMRLAS